MQEVRPEILIVMDWWEGLPWQRPSNIEFFHLPGILLSDLDARVYRAYNSGVSVNLPSEFVIFHDNDEGRAKAAVQVMKTRPGESPIKPLFARTVNPYSGRELPHNPWQLRMTSASTLEYKEQMVLFYKDFYFCPTSLSVEHLPAYREITHRSIRAPRVANKVRSGAEFRTILSFDQRDIVKRKVRVEDIVEIKQKLEMI